MRRRKLELKIPPPVVAGLIAAAMWGASDFEPLFALPSALRSFGAIGIALCGISFDLLGLIAFLRKKTTVNPLNPRKTSTLVTHGVYRITRNPMYVGLGLLLVAWAVHLSGLWALAGPLVFVLYISRFQIRPEERVLAEMFGDAYAAYCSQVRRWL